MLPRILLYWFSVFPVYTLDYQKTYPIEWVNVKTEDLVFMEDFQDLGIKPYTYNNPFKVILRPLTKLKLNQSIKECIDVVDNGVIKQDRRQPNTKVIVYFNLEKGLYGPVAYENGY